MQEIEYEDGEKTKEKFASFLDAVKDAGEKEKKKPIKKLKITRLIPNRKRRSCRITMSTRRSEWKN